MITLASVSIHEFLNKKFFEMQSKENRRVTLDEFGNLFGASKALMSLWMNGDRTPGPEYKKRIIQLYGKDALEAFGEDPDLYAIQENWEHMTPAERRAVREQSEKYRTKNEDTKRAPETRRIRKA